MFASPSTLSLLLSNGFPIVAFVCITRCLFLFPPLVLGLCSKKAFDARQPPHGGQSIYEVTKGSVICLNWRVIDMMLEVHASPIA